MPKKNPINIDLDLRKEIFNKVKRRLETAVDDAVKTKDLQGAAARVQSIILLRTNRGRYLTESGTLEKRKYQSAAHKKKREEMGLPTNRVTLFMGRVGLLEAMISRGRMSGGKPTIEIGYFAGLSEAKALEIARYMNKEGAGTNHIKYMYVGLTDDETDTVIKYLRGRIGGNLKRQFS